MSFHYNEAFENPDYYSSETLVIDRTRPSQSTFFHHNPYDSYEDYNVEGRRGQNPSLLLPMHSMRVQSDAEYSPRDFAFDMPNSSPYGNAHINPSFEYEPEFAQTLPTAGNALNDHYARRPSDVGDGVNFIQRHNKQDVDMVFMTPSSQLRLDPGYNEERKKEEEKLISDLATMSTNERIKAIQMIPKPMSEKREIRNNALMERTKNSHSRDAQINCCTQCFYNTALSFRQFKNSLLDSFQLFKIWEKTLKVIGGKFGTGVCSYFVFLTWLLMFNTFSFLVNFSFLAIPQLIEAKRNHLSFTGLEFLTGAGYFQDTVLYYGFYTNSTVTKNDSLSPYYMQLAYIFTIGIYFIICFLSLLYSMAKSFRNSFVNPQMCSGNAAKLLCIWDFNINNEKAVKLKQKNLSTQIKETLSEMSTESLKLSLSQRISRITIHTVAWVVALGTAVASCAGVYFFSHVNLELILQRDKTELESEAATLILPVVVSLLNHVVPFLYTLFGLVEKFTYTRHQIYTAIVRNIILKISIIGVLCYYWLNIVPLEPKIECWETLVGQDIYRLLVADFICCLLGSFFGEFLRRIFGTTCCKKLGVPEFNIARNVLDLIYAQTLAWIGIFFSPLLPAIQMISFFIIFCVKKVSLMMNCQPPRKAWRASHMNTIFVFLLFFPSFAGVLSVIAITVWRRKPSEACGPFRGLSAIFEAISSWMAILTSFPSSMWVVWIYHNLIESVLFFFILSIIVLIITYLYWQIIEGRKIMVKLLREQIINEGKDKMFLLNKLRALQASNLQNLGKQSERGSFAHRLAGQQMRLPLPNSVESSPRMNQRDSYAEPARISEMTSFSHAVKQDSQPARNAGASEALMLALRARQEAEWEIEDEESS
ncbi:transmembrane channel-like protein 5 [Elgaria multicarinata webbii]|uniref:transmembrane channel-like protein 5 n=1 Tax=Elgaria multicarinata webbii TaxID=159646 RepID=UPI002FCD00B3